jgi:hypothetical protein
MVAARQHPCARTIEGSRRQGQGGKRQEDTLAARGLEEHVRVSLIFAIIVSFMLFTMFNLANVLYFEEFMIHNSRGFMILKNN